MSYLLKRTIVLVIFSFLYISASSDEIRIDSINTFQYPEVSLIFNVMNPDIKGEKTINVLENGNKKEFILSKILSNNKNVDKGKVVLFLLEDMCDTTHPGQKKFFQSIMFNTISGSMANNDMANIAVFDRSRKGESVLHYLLPQYTNDMLEIQRAVSNFKSKNDLFYRQLSSDLYYALYDGINDLVKQFPEENKVIILLSAGKNNIESSESSPDRAIRLAKTYRIPIYSIQYRMQGWEHNRITPISKSTYGKEVITNDNMVAIDSLTKFLNESHKVVMGNTFRISYITEFPQDGKTHHFYLFLNGIQNKIEFETPGLSLWKTLVKHKKYSIPAAIILFVLIVLFVFIKARAVKKRKKNKVEFVKAIQNGETNKKTIEEQQKQLEILKKQNVQRHKKNLDEEHYQKYVKEVINRGIQPRIIFNSKSGKQVLNIRKPIVIIGRDPQNDIVLHDQQVSRKHAKIYYSERKFIIEDLGSRNGTYVNQARIKKMEIQKGDSIEIGAIKLMFVR
jgi:FHA domain